AASEEPKPLGILAPEPKASDTKATAPAAGDGKPAEGGKNPDYRQAFSSGFFFAFDLVRFAGASSLFVSGDAVSASGEPCCAFASGSNMASAAATAAAASSSASVRRTVTSSPRAMRAASSALRATVTVMETSTSG